MQTTTKNTYELEVGDIVRSHGLRLMLDGPAQSWLGSNGRATFAFHALVLNRDESDFVPFHWTVQPDGSHRWAVQGNDLAMWEVES